MLGLHVLALLTDSARAAEVGGWLRRALALVVVVAGGALIEGATVGYVGPASNMPMSVRLLTVAYGMWLLISGARWAARRPAVGQTDSDQAERCFPIQLHHELGTSDRTRP